MGKSRRKYYSKLKSRKYKRGGKRNQQNYLPTVSTQIAGKGVQSGGTVPAPAPAAGININLDYPSVKQSLITFGNAAYNLKAAMTSGQAAAAQAVIAAQSQVAAMTALNTAANSLWSAFNGVAATGLNPGTNGLYKTILNSPTEPLYVPPPAPGPSPAP